MTKKDEFTFNRWPSSGRTAASFSVDVIIISDLMPRLVWSNSRSMVWDDGGEFFVDERHYMLQSINNETRLNRIGENHTTYCRVGSRSADGVGVSSCVVRCAIISLSLSLYSLRSSLRTANLLSSALLTREPTVDRS